MLLPQHLDDAEPVEVDALPARCGVLDAVEELQARLVLAGRQVDVWRSESGVLAAW